MSVTVVVLAFGPEPLLAQCVDAILASRGVATDVVLVDNGCTTDAVARMEGSPGVRVVRPGHNTGYAGGCNLGAAQTGSEHLAFVNGDAVVDPDALARLTAALDDDTVTLASASLRLLDRPDVMNSIGNPVHFLGLSWAGGLGEPASDHARPRNVTSVTGAAFAVRRLDWQALGGFWEAMFAYQEDAELSLRAWQRGGRVVYVPDAVVLHRYEFSRNPAKTYLLERNRLLLLLTLHERRTLLVLLLPALALELAVTAVALRQSWLRDKVRGWWWIFTHGREIRERRQLVQSQRRRSDHELLPRLLTGQFAPGAETGLHPPSVLVRSSVTFWALARRVV